VKNPPLVLDVSGGNDEKTIFYVCPIIICGSQLKSYHRSRIGEPIPVLIGMSVPYFFIDSIEEMLFVVGDQILDDPPAYPSRSPDCQNSIRTDPDRDPAVRPGGEQRVPDRSYFTGAFHFVRVASMSMMNLSLRQSLAYQKLPCEGSSAEDAYRALISFLDQAPAGSEGVLLLSFEMNVLFLGTSAPPDEETLKKIAKAEKLDPAEGDHVLEPGHYRFIQIPLPASIEELPLENLALDEGDLLYLRILKEGSFALVAQLWIRRRAE